ncbi:hypothetical protein [Psychromonas sp. GE-S-Ul-11]|uniref:hypothetical protein n=1 Tax=Psychromonas sp. GE-S-Ul-11 TaxID=3241170 RepID=UPI00390C47F9
MSHRIVNNVGYYKIYPMSFGEDFTFCHYCGRKAGIDMQLEWDHVPALNVKLPADVDHLRKTLVRSCSECNGLASDVPHIDYLERHFWLKAAYLRRYKNILLNDNIFRESTEAEGFLKAYIDNAKVKYHELLRGLGFGIKSIDEIDSPILSLKTKSNRVLSDVIHCYLYFPLVDDEEDTPIDTMDETEENTEVEVCCSINEFIEFLYLECPTNTELLTLEGYYEWGRKNDSRCALLDLPIDPEEALNTKWELIINQLYRLYIDTGVDDQYCAFGKFVTCLKEYAYRHIYSLDEYQEWHKSNIDTLFLCSLPKDPCSFYGKTLEEINKVLGVGVDNRFCSFSEFISYLKDDYYQRIDSLVEYQDWHTSNKESFHLYSLPINPCSFYGKSLEEINEVIDPCVEQIYCSFSRFCSQLKDNSYRRIASLDEYRNWHKLNKNTLIRCSLPKDPCGYYVKTLDEINEALG